MKQKYVVVQLNANGNFIKNDKKNNFLKRYHKIHNIYQHKCVSIPFISLESNLDYIHDKYDYHFIFYGDA